jgi:ribosomal protein L1
MAPAMMRNAVKMINEMLKKVAEAKNTNFYNSVEFHRLLHTK